MALQLLRHGDVCLVLVVRAGGHVQHDGPVPSCGACGETAQVHLAHVQGEALKLRETANVATTAVRLGWLRERPPQTSGPFLLEC